MKLLFFCCLLTAALSCSEQPAPPATGPAQQDPQSPTAASYTDWLNRHDSTQTSTANKAMERLIQLLPQVSPEAKDTAVAAFLRFHEAMARHLQSDTTDYTPAISYDEGGKQTNIPQVLKERIDTLGKAGFTVKGDGEGGAYVDRDMDWVMQHLANKTSAPMQNYLQQVQKEAEEGFALDAGIVISPDQYAQRILYWETFQKNHPRFLLQNEISDRRQYLLIFLFEGMDNTPLLDYQSGKLNTYYAEVLNTLLRTGGNAAITSLLQPYYNALRNGDEAGATAIKERYRREGKISSFDQLPQSPY